MGGVMMRNRMRPARFRILDDTPVQMGRVCDIITATDPIEIEKAKMTFPHEPGQAQQNAAMISALTGSEYIEGFVRMEGSDEMLPHCWNRRGNAVFDATLELNGILGAEYIAKRSFSSREIMRLFSLAGGPFITFLGDGETIREIRDNGEIILFDGAQLKKRRPPYHLGYVMGIPVRMIVQFAGLMLLEAPTIPLLRSDLPMLLVMIVIIAIFLVWMALERRLFF